MDFEEFVRLYLTYSVPGDMTVSKLKEVANKIVKKHLEDTLDAMDPLLKTVKAQLDEGIVTICSKCQRLTYNVDCFVCRWCNLQAVVDNVLDYCSKNHDNFEQRDNGDVYCSECGLIVHSFAKQPIPTLHVGGPVPTDPTEPTPDKAA